ncbi:MAG: cytochrome c oxidase assembly protein [Dehalococcoidia bacterium]
MLPLLHAESIHWHWHPDIVFLCALLIGGYAFAMGGLRHERSDAMRIRWVQVASFMAGVAAIYLVSSWPIHEISESRLASVHMFQHLVYTMVAPPLLIWGTPSWLLRMPLRNKSVFSVARLITHPLIAFAAFNAIQLVTHMPAAVNLALDGHAFHLFVHVLLVSSASLMWWPVLSPLDELPRLSYPLQMAYLFVQSLIPTVLAAFLTFSTGVFYDAYADAPRMWGLSPIEDQQFAGFVMKVLGSIILWSFIAYAFFRWFEQENKSDRGPRWEEVQDEMNRLGLPIEGPQVRGGRLN